MKLTCIVCPKGCQLEVHDNIVTGNLCKRGEAYALQEVNDPRRTLTSTIKLNKADIARLPVISDAPIPKARLLEVMEIIRNTCVDAPIKVDEIIINNVLDLGINIKSSRTIPRK